MEKDRIKIFEIRYSPDFSKDGFTIDVLKHCLFTKAHTKSQYLDIYDLTGRQIRAVVYPSHTNEVWK